MTIMTIDRIRAVVACMQRLLYCPKCGEYLMAGDGECHDCHCGWEQPQHNDLERH